MWGGGAEGERVGWGEGRDSLVAAHTPRALRDSSGAGEQTRSSEGGAQVTGEQRRGTPLRGYGPGGGGSLGRKTPYPPTPEAKSRDEPSRKGAPLLHSEVRDAYPHPVVLRLHQAEVTSVPATSRLPGLCSVRCGKCCYKDCNDWEAWERKANGKDQKQ